MQQPTTNLSQSLPLLFHKIREHLIEIPKNRSSKGKEYSEHKFAEIEPILKEIGYDGRKPRSLYEIRKILKEYLVLEVFLKHKLNYQVFSIMYEPTGQKSQPQLLDSKKSDQKKKNPDFSLTLISDEKIIVEIVSAIFNVERGSKDKIVKSRSQQKSQDSQLYQIYNYELIRQKVKENFPEVSDLTFENHTVKITQCSEILYQLSSKTSKLVLPERYGHNLHCVIDFILKEGIKVQTVTKDLENDLEDLSKNFGNLFTKKQLSILFEDKHKNCNQLKLFIKKLDFDILNLLKTSHKREAREIIEHIIGILEDKLREQKINYENKFCETQNKTQEVVLNFYRYLRIIIHPSQFEHSKVSKLLKFWSQFPLLEIYSQYAEIREKIEDVQLSFHTFLREEYDINEYDLSRLDKVDSKNYLKFLLEQAVKNKMLKYKDENSNFEEYNQRILLIDAKNDYNIILFEKSIFSDLEEYSIHLMNFINENYPKHNFFDQIFILNDRYRIGCLKKVGEKWRIQSSIEDSKEKDFSLI